MNRVLVIDACQRSALAVTRSLGRHNIELITADAAPAAIAGCSRYSSAYFQYPSPESRSEEFIATIAELCRQQQVSMVFPMTEITTELLLKHRDQLGDVVLPFADADTIDQLADKCRLMQLATSLDIPVPDTVYCSAEENARPGERIDYPLVIKPGKSWLPTDQGWINSTVRFANDEVGLDQILKTELALKHHDFMLQQKVPGKGCGVFALYDQGKAVAFFAHRRLHEKPPRGGVSVISESVDIDPQLLQHSKKLLDAASWHGIAMVEYRQHGDRAWLMEVNTRFWGSLQLAIDAGVDFPWLLYQAANGEQIPSIKPHQCGVRMRWLLGDLDWLYLVLKDREFGVGRKLKAVFEFLLWAPLTSRAEVNRLSDLGPFRFEISEYLKHIRSRLG